jgi:uncharacterized protein YdbL (DUF1318 family)
MKFLSLALLFTLGPLATQASTVVESETINVDGYVKEAETSDPELTSLKAEIAKQKKDIVLNKQKAKSYQQLSKSVEKLSETTEEYLDEKKAAQEEIAAYNLKVKCLQSDSPGPECDKFVKRR